MKWALSLAGLVFCVLPKPVDASALRVDPPSARMVGSESSLQLVVTSTGTGAQPVDQTALAEIRSLDEKVVKVLSGGLAVPQGDGATEIVVRFRGEETRAKVVVADFANTRPVQFLSEIEPILAKLGCNSGGCHGKASGQNGFRLSLLGYDPGFDFQTIVSEGRGRRVFPAAPQQSLILRKATSLSPHGGGRRMDPDSAEYRILERWIRQGMPKPTGREPQLVSIHVEPARRVVSRQASQQLRVVAKYSDETTQDVTRLAQFQSNDPSVATIDEVTARVQTLDRVGDVAIMARFGGMIAVARVAVPNERSSIAWEIPSSSNLIDPFVFGKLKELGLPPSETCSDAEFARRSSLDLCGVLPTPKEVASLESDSRPNKRERWVDELLERPAHTDFFTLKWAAILRVKRAQNATTPASTFAFHSWIRQAIASNMPYDEFASRIIAARGEVSQNPAVVWYRQIRTPEDQVDNTAQLFLGLRLQCARCHHHPFEKWGQDDYYGFASFFTRVGRKIGDDPQTPGIYTLSETRFATNPTTQTSRPPKLLGSQELPNLGPFDDPRDQLVSWLRQKDNPFFAQALVNRYWKHFLGVGLVDPEDDFRASNPASNPEVLVALAQDFVTHSYDLKRLIRLIATSKTYERSSTPRGENAADHRNFARFSLRRLPAEVMLDAINTVLDTRDDFGGVPSSFNAVQLPDDGFTSYFLDVFGRPKRDSVCECERGTDINLSQSLHLLNSKEIAEKLSRSARIARWLERKTADEQVVDEMFRVGLSRPPTKDELATCLEHLNKRRSQEQLKQGYQDLLWVLINSKEFQFIR